MIVDFYCPEESLIIELDGAGHFTSAGSAVDVNRDWHLQRPGFRVLRFENKEVLTDPEGVLISIQQHFRR